MGKKNKNKSKIPSSSNSNGIGNGKGKIFVHAFTLAEDPFAEYGHAVGYDTYGKFFLIDLKARHVSQVSSDTHPKALLDERGDATIVSSGSTIYLIGGRRCYQSQGYLHYHSKRMEKNNNKHIVHKGTSWFDLSNPGKGWTQAPLMTFDSQIPSCVSFDNDGNKIYAFGSSIKGSFAEVFDPIISKTWRDPPLTLPPPREDGRQHLISSPAIADPSNNRILLHFLNDPLREEGSVYAYYPGDGGTWECLIEDFGSWFRLAALVDGVLYFLVPNSDDEEMPVILGFDLASKQWLRVCVPYDRFETGSLAREYIALLHLGGSVLCSVLSRPDTEMDTVISLVKFRVKPTGRPLELEVVPLLPVDSYPLKSPCIVVGALAI